MSALKLVSEVRALSLSLSHFKSRTTSYFWMLEGWIVTFIIRERSGGPSSGYISSGFFGGEQYRCSRCDESEDGSRSGSGTCRVDWREQMDRRREGGLRVYRARDWVGSSPCRLSSQSAHSHPEYRLELTIWFVPSIIQNAIAVRLSFFPPSSRQLPLATPLLNHSIGLDHRSPPGPLLPHHRLPLEPHSPALDAHSLRGMDRWYRRERFSCLAVYHRYLGVQVRDQVVAAFVSVHYLFLLPSSLYLQCGGGQVL